MNYFPNIKNRKGFTLIELMVVIGIIAILAAVVIVAVNPARQFASARDRERQAEILALTNAIYQYSVENNGQLPSEITTTPTNLGTGSGLIDFTATGTTPLVPTYIAEIPSDPGTACDDTDTCYTIFTQSGRLVASASSELNPGTFITVVR